MIRYSDFNLDIYGLLASNDAVTTMQTTERYLEDPKLITIGGTNERSTG
jgi:hypothetical protein